MAVGWDSLRSSVGITVAKPEGFGTMPRASVQLAAE